MSDNHRCLAGPACRDATVIDDERVGAPTEEPDTLCPPCHARIENAIRQLPDDWAQLRRALGERSSTAGQKIRSTPTPAAPISTRKAAIMTDIIETAQRAAGLIAATLNTELPAGRRLPAPPPDTKSIPDSLAERTFEETRQHDATALRAYIRLVEPNLNLLAAAPSETFAVWDRFGEDNKQPLVRDTETGEPISARGRIFIDLTGIDIALELVELHHQTRAELGLTRLRHRYPMPCPRCGGRVGRDDGQSIVTCDDRTTCKASWTEREYQFLAGLITRERLDMEILKWLLAEAYWRLDEVRTVGLAIEESLDTILGVEGPGKIVAETIHDALGDHKTPADRAITTDRKDTEQRQTTEDTWAWGDQPDTYRPPKPKPQPPRKPIEHPIAAASLLTVIDIDENAVINGDARCRECNLIHSGDCP